jgi:hypothetical protein
MAPPELREAQDGAARHVKDDCDPRPTYRKAIDFIDHDQIDGRMVGLHDPKRAPCRVAGFQRPVPACEVETLRELGLTGMWPDRRSSPRTAVMW